MDVTAFSRASKICPYYPRTHHLKTCLKISKSILNLKTMEKELYYTNNKILSNFKFKDQYVSNYGLSVNFKVGWNVG